MSTPTLSPHSLLREADGLRHGWSKGRAEGHRWWLLQGNEAVAYCKTLTVGDNGPARLMLVDVEVRPGFQGQGLCRELFAAVEEATGERLWTDGGFTAAGFGACKHLPLAPGFTREVCFRDQHFVTSWSKRTTKV